MQNRRKSQITINYASTHRTLGKLTKAEKLRLKIAQRAEKALGKEHPGTLTALAGLAATY
jgi:Tetratricopeptide repeat